MKRFTLALSLALLVGALACSQVQAQSATLDTLLVPGATFNCGDKQFFNFTAYSSVATGGASPVPASQITVVCVLNGNIDTLRFESAVMHVSAGQTQDTDFTYSVKTLSGAKTITGVDLRVSGGVTPPGLAEVTENGPGFSMLANTSSGTAFSPVPLTNQIDGISKDIALDASQGGAAAISGVDQSFHQQSSVPEPASVGLLVMGGIGLAGYGWRRRRAAK
jgi:hypothetical protein